MAGLAALNIDQLASPSTPSKRHSSFLPTTSTMTTPFVSDADGYAYPHRKPSSATFHVSGSTPSSTISTPSSPSKQSTVLPLQQAPPPIRPNAHPYAIKSTSGGILSRSATNTSSPHYKETHRYAPPSPSPTRTSYTGGGPPSPTKASHHGNGGDLAGGRRSDAYRGHRYSQSLTDVSGMPAPDQGPAPRPLPVPPNLTGDGAGTRFVFPDYAERSMSASPTKSARFLELQAEFTGEERTPKQVHNKARGKRADTLPPGQAAPFIFPTSRRDSYLDLPEDPKTWTPTQLAMYLQRSSSEDLANLVLAKDIGGRAFLRLASSSDERVGIDLALRDASRALRRSSLRGRIWGFDTAGSSPYQRQRSDSESSSGSLMDDEGLSSNASRRRGLVRGMIASLENLSGSEKEDDEERQRPRSQSPTKRGLPQRGRVEDLFGPVQPNPNAEEDKWVDSTIKAHGNAPGQTYIPQTKELPGLLPLPPTFTGESNGPLSPIHTGSTISVPLMLSPAHTGGAEFGYLKTATASPGIHRSEKASSRLLPLPPVMPPPPPPPKSPFDGMLHHPVPRRGGNQVHDLVSTIGDDEPSIEELLRESDSTLGVKGWDMDVGTGETVKKVPVPAASALVPPAPSTAYPDSAEIRSPGADVTEANAEAGQENTAADKELLVPRDNLDGVTTADLSFVSGRTGRRAMGIRPKVRNPTGARAIESRGKKGSPGSNGDSSASASEGETSIRLRSSDSRRNKQPLRRKSGQGVLALFDPPTTEVLSESLIKIQAEDVEERDQAHDLRRAAAEERERGVAEREGDVGEREEAMNARSAVLDERQKSLDQLQIAIDQQGNEISQRADQLDQRESLLNQCEVRVSQRETSVSEREIAVAAQEESTRSREVLIGAREKKVEEKEADLSAREREIEIREPPAQQQLEDQAQQPQVEEDTFALATRLFRRIVSPVLGERLGGYLLRPLDITPEDGASASFQSHASPSTSTSEPTGPPAALDDDQNRTTERKRRSILSWPLTYLRNEQTRETTSYLVLLGIGVVAVVIRVLVKRAVFGGAGAGLFGRAAARGAGVGLRR